MTFNDWHKSIYGYAPFPWQSRLAEDWATAIAVPPGSGKTTVLDAWLYRRIHGADVPRRLWYVVDRRVLVDGAFRRAQKLVETTNQDVQVVRLRGGTFDRSDMPRPDQPAIICSTVDQFGSRLLGQGYGVGKSSRPLHAALAGTDAVLVLDEAHISRPLLETVAACRSLGANVELLPMSGTLADTKGALVLNGDDRSHPVLAQRLAAQKFAKLGTGKLSTHARALRKAGANTIAIWCNTVPTAITTAKELRTHGETIMITGRDRQYDRDQLMDRWHDRLKSGAAEYPKVYVVTTQCLEVGVDWDFQAMVTECCSVDALKQRAGRLDRLGNAGKSHAVIIKPKKTVPVYGETALATYEWLKSIATDNVVDLGLSNPNLGSPPAVCTHDEPSAPRLSSRPLDAWSIYAGKSAQGRKSESGLELLGLKGSSLLGWMAAVGIARLTDCRLCWRRKGPRWIAVLDTDMTYDELAEFLYNRTRENPYGTSSDKNLTKTTVEEWLSWPDQWSIASHYQTKDGLQKSRLLSCGSIGKQFTTSIDKINASIEIEDFLAAICGPWKVRNGCGLGWGDNEQQVHGDRFFDPADSSKTLKHINSVVFWGPTRLAVEAMPMIPAWVPQKNAMTWPIWQEPLSPDSIRGRIIACAGDALWTATRKEHDQGRITFGQSRPVNDARPNIPDIAPWLHGLGTEDTDCRVLWRDDISDEALSAMPPRQPETASVSLGKMANLEPKVIRYRGSDDIEQIDSQDVVPGDVIVLAIGTDIAPTPPTDIAEVASIAAQRPRMRVISSKALEWIDTLADNEVLELIDHDIEDPELVPYPGGFVIAGRTTTSVRAGSKVALNEHNRDVGELARVIAANAGLNEMLTSVCELVGQHHDDGKADPRFQRWLGAGDELLAKSGQTRAQSRAARQASGYPRGQRHELLSAVLVDGDALVRYLVSSHHGHCRPFAPPQHDAEPIEVAGVMTDDVVTDHDDRYWSLTREYGWWMLSLLSGIVVASDHIVSAKPYACKRVRER